MMDQRAYANSNLRLHLQKTRGWFRTLIVISCMGLLVDLRRKTALSKACPPRLGATLRSDVCPLLQEIPDLCQQFLLLGEWRRRGSFLLSRLHEPPQKLDDEEENGQRDQEKVDHLSEKQPIRDFLPMDDSLPLEMAMLSCEQHTDQGHDEVLDQRVDDLAEGRPDDHPDCEINDIAFEGEVLEFLDQGPGLPRRYDRRHPLHRFHIPPPLRDDDSPPHAHKRPLERFVGAVREYGVIIRCLPLDTVAPEARISPTALRNPADSANGVCSGYV